MQVIFSYATEAKWIEKKADFLSFEDIHGEAEIISNREGISQCDVYLVDEFMNQQFLFRYIDGVVSNEEYA